jgi:coproporphyrinogen III oxidase
MNVRFFSCGDRWWFGGGVDLTPYYPILRQVQAFHRLLRDLCEAHNRSYDDMKRKCDEYFYLPHRRETRGIGGIFYDAVSDDFEGAKAFCIALGDLFIQLYGLFVNNAKMSFTQQQREFQLYRRGRYVEFNLLYDRGTKFGLASNGRIESILVSLPATVHYSYDYTPPKGSKEEYLYLHFLRPQDWLGLSEDEAKAMKSPEGYVTAFQSSQQTKPVSARAAGGSKQHCAGCQGQFGTLTRVTSAVAAAAAVAGVVRYFRA